MDHQIVRVGGREVLLVDVCSSAGGHGVGYGIMLKRIERVLRFGAAVGMPVFYVREARAINRAVFQLRSPDVEILPGAGWRAAWLRVVWALGAPFRSGDPRLWVQHLIARTLLGAVYQRVERSRVIPRPLRRAFMKPRVWHRSVKSANAAYSDQVARAWQRTFKTRALPIIRAAEAEGRDRPLRLALPPDAAARAEADAARLGIAADARIVTVHVREAGYRARAGLTQRALDDLRNARVETYLEAFRALAERGYTIVRLGDPTMTPVRQPGVVDLATSPHRTEWVETWCIQRSEFLVGCDSGPSWLAFLLGVPVLTVNALHFRDITRQADRLICKLARERATGRILTLEEMLTGDYLRNGLDTARFEHLDNRDEDVRDAVVDMIDAARGTEERSPAQERFNARLVEVGRDLPHEWSGMTGVAIVRQPRGTIARRFAEKYLGFPA